MKSDEKFMLQFALFLCAVMMLGGIASALEAKQVVMVTATVPELLIFTANEESSGEGMTVSASANQEEWMVLLGAVYPSNEPVSAVSQATLFSTCDWIITGPTTPIYMSNGEHTLNAPLTASVTPNSGGPGTILVTASYSQAFTLGDYAASYSAPVIWTASARF